MGNENLKITSDHLKRKAIVYVRQSSEAQVLRNTASPLYQRDQRNYALQYGWTSSQIEVVEDLGLSASISGNRDGFERILREIAQNRVGAIFYHDVSRLSRKPLDFHTLLDLCRSFDVLFFEAGQLRDPKDSNDTFMVSMQAGVVQWENHERAKKMKAGKVKKVETGFAVSTPPVGYYSPRKGLWEKHPDPDVRARLDLAFEQAQKLPSVYALWKFFDEKDLKVPVRASGYKEDHSIRWERPTYRYLHGLVVCPNYTQDYHFGRFVSDPRHGFRERGIHKGRPRQRKGDPNKKIVARDHHEAYIDREAFEELREKYAKNSWRRFQPVRPGRNLLQGIIYCADCGRRLASHYGKNQPGGHFYQCSNVMGKCTSLGRRVNAARVDDEVEEILLKLIKKPNIEAVIQRYDELKKDRLLSVDEHARRVRQAEKEASEAERAYGLVNPENHLVKETLEAAWQERIQALRQLKGTAFEMPETPPPLTKEQKERLFFLCEKFEETFKHRSVDMVVKKQLVRCFVERVVLTVKDDLVLVEVHWHDKEKAVTTLPVYPPRCVYHYILEQHQKGLTEEAILEAMRRDGISIRGRVFTKKSILNFYQQHGLKSTKARQREAIWKAVTDYDQQGMTPEVIAKHLKEGGIQPMSSDSVILRKVKNILKIIKRKPRTRQPKNWNVILPLIEEGLLSCEIVSRLNAMGCTTETGLPYTYQRMCRIIKRMGRKLPKPRGLSRKVEDQLVEMCEKGLTSPEAYELLLSRGEIDSSPTTKSQVYRFFLRHRARRTRAGMVPEDFSGAIDELMKRGLNSGEIAEELNTRGLKTARGNEYNASIVYDYRYKLGISKDKGIYDPNGELMKFAEVLRVAGKNGKEIAAALNEAGFQTINGRPFTAKKVHALFSWKGRSKRGACGGLKP